MRRYDRSRTLDRLLAGIEIPALGVWVGALVAFAFLFAPAAFRTVAPLDLGRFAALIAGQIGALSLLGAACGGIAVLCAALRAQRAGDRRADLARVLLVALALGAVAAEWFAIVPAMRGLVPGTAAYAALHGRSSAVYGIALLCAAAALVVAAVRSDE